jgi:hypothetical protein
MPHPRLLRPTIPSEMRFVNVRRSQPAGLGRSLHRPGLITVPNASRLIMMRKNTTDMKRKNALRIPAIMTTHLLLSYY